MNHIHEYPVLENYFPQEFPILVNDQEKEEINLTEIEKRLFILIGKKIYHLIVPLQNILVI